MSNVIGVLTVKSPNFQRESKNNMYCKSTKGAIIFFRIGWA